MTCRLIPKILAIIVPVRGGANGATRLDLLARRHMVSEVSHTRIEGWKLSAYSQDRTSLHGEWSRASSAEAEQGEHRHRVKNRKIIAPQDLDALRSKLIQAVNVNEPNPGRVRQDIPVAEFWNRYLAHFTKPIDAKGGLPRMKPSTIRSSKQIWNQHLKNHFGDITLLGLTRHGWALVSFVVSATANAKPP